MESEELLKVSVWEKDMSCFQQAKKDILIRVPARVHYKDRCQNICNIYVNKFPNDLLS